MLSENNLKSIIGLIVLWILLLISTVIELLSNK